MIDMKHSTELVEMPDAVKLYTQQYLVEDAQAVVLLIHGLGEHSNRYAELISMFVSHRISVLTMDLRGFGQSAGDRAYVSSYQKFMDDIKFLEDKADRLYPHIPKILYGHSMGGNLVLNYGIRMPNSLQGIIATSPYLRMTHPKNKLTLSVAHLLNGIIPKLRIPNGLKVTDISRKQEEQQAYQEDPLVSDLVSIRLFVELEKAGLYAIRHAKDLHIPTLIYHGTQDQITDPKISAAFAESNPDYVQFIAMEGWYHELHHELAGAEFIEEVYQDLIAFIPALKLPK